MKPSNDAIARALWEEITGLEEGYTPCLGEFLRSVKRRAEQFDAEAAGSVLPNDGKNMQVNDGEVLVVVHGLTGVGKSAVAGEIEILCKALGLEVRWENGDEEKFLTHADWTEALELYKPRVRIVEVNTPRGNVPQAERGSLNAAERQPTHTRCEKCTASILAGKWCGGPQCPLRNPK